MKYLCLIVIFCFSRAFSQVGPPDLRCLQVSTTGEVTLTWIPPADPGNVFFSYEIYTSTSATGVFTLAGALPGSITTSTFIDAAATADVSARYYYVISKSGATGGTSSISSDTLKTIFLNLNPGNASQEYLQIAYNNLHQPKLATTSNSFSILREYPLGIWTTFTTTPDIIYNDTLSLCQASLNYQVRINDNSGCVSTSNYAGGIFFDKHQPNEPVIDSISVLPNGEVVLSWFVPHDLDIIKYRIYELSTTSTNTINSTIDTVFGRTSTFYLYTASASTTAQPVSLFLSAIDSCGKISFFTNTGGTMFLSQKYDRCNYKTDLSWTPYKNMPKGLKEYWIYYSSNGTTFSVVGTTTNTKFTHTGVAPDKNVCYYIRAVNTDLDITSSSNRICFYSTQVQSPDYVYILYASIQPDNLGKLQLLIDTSRTCKGMNIFRSEDGLNYDEIGFVPFSDTTPYYTFIDKINLDPQKRSYFYKATVKDSCGNTRATSIIAKTILLNVSDDKEFIFTKHLTWSTYSGFAGGLNSYNIYRVINDASVPKLITNVGLFSNTYTDDLEYEAPNGAKIAYMVEAVEGQGNPYGYYVEKATSNQKQVYMEGRIYIPEAFAPRGHNKIWLPVTHFIDKSEYNVKIFNRWGNKVFETTDDTVGWDGGDGPTGIYAYVISYKNARGEYLEVKGTLLML